MVNNYLLIVEGEKTEKSIFEKILIKYGFNVIRKNERLDVDNYDFFRKSELSDDKNNVIIVQGPRNRIHDFLKEFDSKTDDLERIFRTSADYFQGVFLMYDVDHNDDEDIKNMFRKFPEETEGMLLLSSPCIEVLGEYDHSRELRYNHLKEYKADLNVYHKENTKESVEEYIINNFEKLCIYYLDKNRNDFEEKNIMEHPSLIIEKINELNERVNYPKDSKKESYVIYRYLTTVVYVFIAYINQLTREIDNYEVVRQFFEKENAR